MAISPEIRARLEQEGVEVIKARLGDSKNYTDEYRAAAVEWIAEHDAQRLVASDASQRESNRIARSAKNAAWVAAISATIAIPIAIASLLISIFRPFDH